MVSEYAPYTGSLHWTAFSCLKVHAICSRFASCTLGGGCCVHWGTVSAVGWHTSLGPAQRRVLGQLRPADVGDSDSAQHCSFRLVIRWRSQRLYTASKRFNLHLFNFRRSTHFPNIFTIAVNRLAIFQRKNNRNLK